MDEEAMKAEVVRLQTFEDWPSSAPAIPERIARAGFYATGNELEVKCPWCKKKLSEWSVSSLSVMIRHRVLAPLCPFVTDPIASGNIAINAQPIRREDIKNEQVRLSTFRNWPISHILPATLAKAGFFYYNDSDRVSCAWCHGVIGKWEEGDDPFAEHEKFFPNCPKVKLGPNLTNVDGDAIPELGIHQVEMPKREKFSLLDARIRTYARWPCRDIQNPELLAAAGFYYMDVDDHTRCFHCSGNLRQWHKDDDPWYEHAKWFPLCKFLNLAKGSEYINRVQHETKPTLDEAMCSDPVRKVLEMGLSEERIRRVTKSRLDTLGRPYPSVETLVEAMLDSTLENNNESQNSPSVVENVKSIFGMVCNSNASGSTNQDNRPVESNGENAQNVQTTENGHPTIPIKTETAVVASRNISPSKEKEKKKNFEEENRLQCKVCFEDEVGVVFLPCGHLVTCFQCASGLSLCPLCRKSIKAYVRTYLS
ncbi:Death-associated inhibitor of apoptosis 2 [Pseudolycoriella hygida]|uniref:Death-associated inhibitor of apoptosis 2 n=1 Tax=Pseudolycoriella hygida TaxID=35572 RepID=A0A9Q0NC31_9DIPT|nr:Death-associated inhibitor of apoptosis 2 [Pseudolycoriella hygida]